MSKFALVTDSGCALTKDLRDRFGIEGVALGNLAYPDGHSEKADLDWERTTPKEYFDSMASKKFIYQSSCPNINEIEDLFRPFAKEGRDVLMVTISHGLSGTFNFALKAAENIMKEFPKAKIVVVDSLRYSTAEGLILSYAAKLRDEGKSAEETAKWIEENKGRFHQIGIMDDLFFLARTGRISKAKAFFGNMASVEPIADFNYDGLSEVIGKGKGKKKTLLADIKYIKATIEKPEEQLIFVCHSNRDELADWFAEEIKKEIAPKEIIVSSVDQFCGANIGPGLVATFYVGSPISEDLSKEKALMAECLK